MSQPVEDIIGYDVTALDVQACVSGVVTWIKNGQHGSTVGHSRWLACLNPHSHVVSLSDAPFSQALHTADWLIPDGAGVALASKILGGEIRERVTGSDIFRGVLEELNLAGGFSVFFLGSTEETLAAIRARMAEDFPNVRLAGTYSPPFKPVFSDDDNDRMVTAINAAAPDVLWVGLTAPKQEKWIYQNKDKLNVKFIGAIGAVFDFYAGNVKRPPVFVQKMGFEWLYRWAQEPKRLLRRNLISTPKFIMVVLKQKLHGN